MKAWFFASPKIVMPGLDPGIHVFVPGRFVDGRATPGHDD
jgi:hypothetical protein